MTLEKRKILISVNRDISHSGGVNQFLVSAKEAFSSNGYDVVELNEYINSNSRRNGHWVRFIFGVMNLRICSVLLLFLPLPIGCLLFSRFLQSIAKDFRCIYVPLSQPLPWIFAKLGSRVTFTIHDLQHIYMPENFSHFERIKRDLYNRRLVESLAKIHCESSEVVEHIKIRYSKINPNGMICKCYPLPPNSVYVSRIAVRNPVLDYNSWLKKSEELKTGSEHYLLYPAATWPHKNHMRLFEALQQFIKDTELPLRLYLTGKRTAHWAELNYWLQDKALQRSIKHLGYCSTKQLSMLYSNSIGLIMPSLFESVSIPIYEALSLGIPCAASLIKTLEEQTYECCLHFDPLDIKSIRDCIGQLTLDCNAISRVIYSASNRYSPVYFSSRSKEFASYVANSCE
jgi:hypothetical protein